MCIERSILVLVIERISIAGKWTAPQVKAVRSMLAHELTMLNLELDIMDITTHGDACSWYLLYLRHTYTGVVIDQHALLKLSELIRTSYLYGAWTHIEDLLYHYVRFGVPTVPAVPTTDRTL